MITKQQWAIICYKIQSVRHLQPFIQGKRVVDVDLFKNEIVTSLQGQPKTVYNFDSAKGKTYSDIMKSINLTSVSLADLMKYGEK
jgi:hypothetical protein